MKAGFPVELYNLALNGDVQSVCFVKLNSMPKGEDFGLQLQTDNGHFPIERWIAHMPSTKSARVQTFFGKLRTYGFTELPLTHCRSGSEHAAKRRKCVQVLTKYYYHTDFQPGRVDRLLTMTAAPKGRATPSSSRDSTDDVVQTLQARLDDALNHCEKMRQRERYMLHIMHHKDNMIIDLRQRLLVAERHKYDITDENGKAVAGEGDHEVPSSCIPDREIQKFDQTSRTDGDSTPTSVADLKQQTAGDQTTPVGHTDGETTPDCHSDNAFDELINDLMTIDAVDSSTND